MILDVEWQWHICAWLLVFHQFLLWTAYCLFLNRDKSLLTIFCCNREFILERDQNYGRNPLIFFDPVVYIYIEAGRLDPKDITRHHLSHLNDTVGLRRRETPFECLYFQIQMYIMSKYNSPNEIPLVFGVCWFWIKGILKARNLKDSVKDGRNWLHWQLFWKWNPLDCSTNPTRITA